MVIRYDFLYYLVDNMRFEHIINFSDYCKEFVMAWVNDFNNLNHKEYYKYNNNLTYDDVIFSLKCFFEHLNYNHYNINIKHGVVDWIVDSENNIHVGFFNDKSNYEKLITKEYLNEWKKYGYAYYQ